MFILVLNVIYSAKRISMYEYRRFLKIITFPSLDSVVLPISKNLHVARRVNTERGLFVFNSELISN